MNAAAVWPYTGSSQAGAATPCAALSQPRQSANGTTREDAARVDRYARFRQRASEAGGLRGGAFWEDDSHFDLDVHMHHRALPEPGDRAALQELVGDLMAESPSA